MTDKPTTDQGKCMDDKPKYNDENDPIGIKRRHDKDFGEGSWEELERGVLKRHPEFAMFHNMEIKL